MTPDLCMHFRGVMKDRSKFRMQKFEHRTSNAQHRTSNMDIARAAQALVPRVALPVYKLIEYLIENSTLDVRCWTFILYFSPLIEYVPLRFAPGQEP